MRKNSILKLFVVIIIILACAFLAFNEVKNDKIRTGIDIRGGVSAVFEPDIEKGSLTNEEIGKGLASAKTILDKRLDGRGIFDRNISIDTINGRITVEIPWAAGETDFNPQKTINELGRTALLTFQEVDADKVDENGYFLPTGRIVLQGTQVKDANPARHPDTGEWIVVLDLEPSEPSLCRSDRAFERKRIAIFMDDQYISAPLVGIELTAVQRLLPVRPTL